MTQPAIQIDRVDYSYGQRRALRELTLEIPTADIFAFLGPNGGGKTTLFRLLSTLVPLQLGEVRICGLDLRREVAAIRRTLGVVFQAPSLDRKLTVLENVRCHAALYGLAGNSFRTTYPAVLERLGLSDRANDLVESLSGGMRRRVELAQTLLHQPRLLLLDEPSTGLDPGARIELWSYLRQLREEQGVTVVLTTHLLEEAEKADHLAILDEGQLVAHGVPDELRAEVGGATITIQAPDAMSLAHDIRQQLALEARCLDDVVRLETRDGATWLARLVETFGARITSITLGQPTLEDVFIAKTGHRFRAAASAS